MASVHRDGLHFSGATLIRRLQRWLNHGLRRSKVLAGVSVSVSVSVLLAACSQQPLAPHSAEVAPAVQTAPSAQASSMDAKSTAPRAAVAPAPAPAAASTLGTQWGEGRESPVRDVDAVRITPHSPQALRSVRYTDEESIRKALGANANRQLNILLADGKVEWSVVDEQGNALPIYSTKGRSDFQVAGRHGARYELVYVNRSQRNFEVVATVDGLDVLSGRQGSAYNGGYLLEPGQTLRIDGFRKSQQQVAAFRFASKDNAYASNTPAGSPRNIGVIGTALFEVRLGREEQPERPARPGSRSPRGPEAFPADENNGKGRFAPAPQYR